MGGKRKRNLTTICPRLRMRCCLISASGTLFSFAVCVSCNHYILFVTQALIILFTLYVTILVIAHPSLTHEAFSFTLPVCIIIICENVVILSLTLFTCFAIITPAYLRLHFSLPLHLFSRLHLLITLCLFLPPQIRRALESLCSTDFCTQQFNVHSLSLQSDCCFQSNACVCSCLGAQ